MLNLLNTSSAKHGHTVLVTDSSLGRVSLGIGVGVVSGRSRARVWAKKVAGAGMMGFMRSGVRPGAAGMLTASGILDYLPTPVTVFISKMCLGPGRGATVL